jgi:hypothetical protein
MTMGTRPNKHLEAMRAAGAIRTDETYVGGFIARDHIRLRWYLLLGPFAALRMRQYQVVVTDRRVLFGRLSMTGALTGVDAFGFHELERIAFRKGKLAYRIAIGLRNGRALELAANHKGLVSMEAFLCDEATKQYLTDAVAKAMA